VRYFAVDQELPVGKLPMAGRRQSMGSMLRWMASNVSLEKDAADNLKPSKKKSIERIDGIVALIMGIDRATTQPASEISVYTRENRGFIELG
jgi:phage terminase large subunit-like protein